MLQPSQSPKKALQAFVSVFLLEDLLCRHDNETSNSERFGEGNIPAPKESLAPG